ncbi:hypothetical protein AB0C77_28675 [Streptomyces sp. NPDC048629]|uniref:hypothetical protein n=1 Tax=Streptomyces sp. NPDC048629 TaxID=3154824 RepID=UPI00341A7D71
MLARVFRRSTAGRIATLAGTAVLTSGLATETVIAPGLVAAVATGSLGLATNINIWRAPEHVKTVCSSLYLAPHAGCAALLLAEYAAPDTPLSITVQAGCVALWTAATWWIRPGRLARDFADVAVDQELATVQAPDEPAEVPGNGLLEPTTPAGLWWAREFAIEGGIAPGTVLLDYQRLDERCVAAVIGAAKRGTPVPKISAEQLSARLNMPQELIEIGPVPGHGAGVCLLVIGPRPQSAGPQKTEGSDEETWAEIAKAAMPGVELVESNTYALREELT